jgi:hypothetical protein
MIKDFAKNIIFELSSLHFNLMGKNINDKIIIFESDDWGSTRMTSKRAYQELLEFGIPLYKSAYCKYDTLESALDLSSLAEVLSAHKNVYGEHPKFTMNYVSANPDFQKIQDSGRTAYFCEPFLETYKKSEPAVGAFKILKKGMQEGIFMPQFHGRDHVNVPLWLELLKTNDAFSKAFDYGIWGLSLDVLPEIKKSVQATYDSTDFEYTKNSIIEGLALFEEQFGFKSKSFIANNYVWDNNLSEVLNSLGVVHFQTMKYQILPNRAREKRTLIRRTFGSTNSIGQTYAPRNCAFEPTEFGHNHLHTLKQIKRAFFYKKPAIISTHRINFVGGLDIKKRDQNLLELDRLLRKILKFWPDVKFVSSDQMHDIILKLK